MKDDISAYYDRIGENRLEWRDKNRYYHESNLDYFRFLIPAGKRVLLLGSSTGDLIRYPGRVYGDSIISRFRHGWLLLKMTLYAFRKMKMV